MYGSHEAHGAGCGSKIITSLQLIQVTTMDFRITEILKSPQKSFWQHQRN